MTRCDGRRLTAIHTYDGDGKRVKKSNGELYWYGAGSEVLIESNLSGTISDEYIFFGGKRIARLKVASWEINFYFADHLDCPSKPPDQVRSMCALSGPGLHPWGGEGV